MSGNIDPVADFLAREQQDLAGLEEDDQETTPPQPDILLAGGGTDEMQADQAGILDLDNQQPQSIDGGFVPVDMPGGDEQQGGLSNGIGPADPAYNQLSDDFQGGLMLNGDRGDQVNDDNDRPMSDGLPKIEPEKIRRWRQEQRVRLDEKDALEMQKQNEWKEQAKKELADWYKNRNEQLEATKRNNNQIRQCSPLLFRLSEQEFVGERDAELPGQEWQRIAKLCEFNPKSVNNTKDVSRMRSLLLQLKAKDAQWPVAQSGVSLTPVLNQHITPTPR